MMPNESVTISRREFVAAASAACVGLAAAPQVMAYDPKTQLAADDDKALIGMTLDVEMSRHYPTWEIMHWDYEKGNLNQSTKQYVREACRRVKAKGGVIHCFVLGQTFEQEDLTWLKEVVEEGHPVGNHTYDHVNVWSKSPRCQFLFQRAPWLVEGKTAKQVITENIHMTTRAIRTRLGVDPVGFRTPGGSGNGLIGRPDVQKILLDCGFDWVSAMAPGVAVRPENPTDKDFDAVLESHKKYQPFVYPSGLAEVPMSPLGDVASFRREKKKWKIGDFLKMIERIVHWVIENRATYDLLSHPSIMCVEDPEFRSYELICDMVNASGGKAAVVGLDVIAQRAQLQHKKAASAAADS